MKRVKYVCEKCKESFCSKSALSMHQITEQRKGIKEHVQRGQVDEIPEQVFKCESCSKVFSSKYNLKIHKSQKKHSCEECDLDYCLAGALSAHREAVHRRKDFKCTSCDKDFKRKYHLERHTEHKTLCVCENCGTQLCNYQDLLKHKKIPSHYNCMK